jgi:hypothetical protein
MTYAIKCLKVNDGLMFFVPEPGKSRINASDISISVNEVGVHINAGDIIMPVFDGVLGHFAKNPNVMIWFVSGERFVEESFLLFEADRDAILEAKGAWEYRKSREALVREEIS